MRISPGDLTAFMVGRGNVFKSIADSFPNKMGYVNKRI
jgi:hypothetical protein